MHFFSKEAFKIGDKLTLDTQVAEITDIPISAIQGTDLSQFSINERLSWAVRVEITIKKDQVYCVLPIVDLYSALMYGEGISSALRRLCAEVAALEGQKSEGGLPYFLRPYRQLEQSCD